MDKIKDAMVAYGKEVKRKRLSKWMTQTELAKELGVSSTHLSAVERAAQKPSFELMVMLEEKIGASWSAAIEESVHMKGSELEILVKWDQLTKSNKGLALRLIDAVLCEQAEGKEQR